MSGPSMQLRVEGLEEVMKKLQGISLKIRKALLADARNVSKQMEKWAKENAKWTDRTGLARANLKAHVSFDNTNTLLMALAHHMYYGVFLELCNAGKYAILEDAIQRYAPELIDDLHHIIAEVVNSYD